MFSVVVILEQLVLAPTIRVPPDVPVHVSVPFDDTFAWSCGGVGRNRKVKIELGSDPIKSRDKTSLRVLNNSDGI